MRINIVFNLESVEELEQLTGALKEAATLQAKIKLENNIKILKAERDHILNEVSKLSNTHRDLSIDKTEAGMTLRTEPEAPQLITESSSSLDEDADRIIATLNEELEEAIERRN